MENKYVAGVSYIGTDKYGNSASGAARIYVAEKVETEIQLTNLKEKIIGDNNIKTNAEKPKNIIVTNIIYFKLNDGE